MSDAMRMKKKMSTNKRVAIFGISGLLTVLATFLVIYFFFPGLLRPPAGPGATSLEAPADYSSIFAVFQQAKVRAAEEAKELELEMAAEDATDGEPGDGTEPGGDGAAAGDFSDDKLFLATDEPSTFSSTNIQVEGVQEGDIVKTDGKHIYALNGKTLTVIDPAGGKPKVVARIDASLSALPNPYFELYVVDNRLVALKDSYSGNEDEDYELDDTFDYDLTQSTGIDIFNIENPAQPAKLASYELSGTTVSSRMIGSVLYLACNYAITDLDAIAQDQPETFVPFVTSAEGTTLAAPQDIRISPDMDQRDTTYTHVVSINVADTSALVSQASLLGGSDLLYASLENLYLMAYSDTIEDRIDGIRTTDSTTISRLTLQDGLVNFAQSARIPGTIADQFSVDEKDGHLRVVSTFNEYVESALSESYTSDSRVYVLNTDMNLVGELTGLAEGEDLYSCRFIDNFAYFVTYAEVDPLFAVDLSDPTSPTLKSELTVPGFSEYLHPWDTGLLLGFGMGSSEEDKENDFGDSTLKLSMFDTSNPLNVTEKHTAILDGFSYSEALEDHHSILINRDKNLIAFPADESYLVYSYDAEAGFKQIAELTSRMDIPQPSDDEDSLYLSLRGIFVGDVFYLIVLGGPEVGVQSYSLPGFKALN